MKTGTRSIIGKFWPLLELFKDQTTESNKIVHGYLKGLVENALKEKARAGTQGGRKDEEKTFLSHLADSTDGKLHRSLSPHSTNEGGLYQTPKPFASRFSICC